MWSCNSNEELNTWFCIEHLRKNSEGVGLKAGHSAVAKGFRIMVFTYGPKQAATIPPSILRHLTTKLKIQKSTLDIKAEHFSSNPETHLHYISLAMNHKSTIQSSLSKDNELQRLADNNCGPCSEKGVYLF